MIKFYDIYRQDQKLHVSILNDIKKIFKKGDFILGNDVLSFEKNFSRFCNSKFSVGCANGTDALTIALRSLNLKENSEVIIPAMTYCSTAFSVINANLKPVLVDTEFMKSTISISHLKKKINSKTKVIMPVHLYGSVTNMNEIKRIIRGKNIFIIDDCAQAHGARDDNGNKVGSLADISTFSLYPGKNLGAYGDAGIITTNNRKFYKTIKKIRNLGSEVKFKHDLVGMNSRLDSLQAIILNHKLKLLSKLNSKRRKIAFQYDNKIANQKIQKLKYSKFSIYHQYVLIVKKRNELIKYLKKAKIQYGFHYPYAIHQLDAFKKYFKREKFPNSEMLAKNGISIPIDPNLSKKEIDYIISKLNSF
jgi:dTDP-4-amino-4,6-dideoxygalactose transaminase